MAAAINSIKSRKSLFSHMLRPRWALLWLVLCALLASRCEADKPHYCGEKLAEMLDMYCNGTFRKYFYLRRRRFAAAPTQILRPVHFNRLLRQLRMQEQLLLRAQQQLEQMQTPPSPPQLQLQTSQPLAQSPSESGTESKVPASATAVGQRVRSRRMRRQEGGRRMPGVVDECCDNGCTYADILYYCR